ncbi:uncharacterized protein LOC107489505 [Arachis duranensis]|uniref:Uncharacterized protein LOC107489505 n=1 Tax=Arachis duranensis TaxID=130453 RepID=A0A6P4DBZ4_ARADU|nr:uncharacterized protein LOC107489505 [Arachis duranensis]
MNEVVQKEVLQLWQVGVIYPISDSPWVSPVQVVPKKGRIIVVPNEKNELIPTRIMTGWHICIDYRKLNEATRKDRFPLPFMDQMLERLVGHEYYCFLDGYSGYNQIVVDPKDQEKTSFTWPYALKYLLIKQDSKPRLIRWVLLLQEFNIKIKDRSRAENKLMMIQESPWFADIANFKAIGELPTNINKYMRKKLLNDAKHYIWDEPYLFKKGVDGILRRCISQEEGQEVL